MAGWLHCSFAWHGLGQDVCVSSFDDTRPVRLSFLTCLLMACMLSDRLQELLFVSEKGPDKVR